MGYLRNVVVAAAAAAAAALFYYLNLLFPAEYTGTATVERYLRTIDYLYAYIRM